jgi:ABC-type antimicrobial peptide transport system permease subunit
MRSMVYGISAHSPLILLVAAVIMIDVALVAVIVPVLRATQVDPVRELRTE